MTAVSASGLRHRSTFFNNRHAVAPVLFIFTLLPVPLDLCVWSCVLLGGRSAILVLNLCWLPIPAGDPRPGFVHAAILSPYLVTWGGSYYGAFIGWTWSLVDLPWQDLGLASLGALTGAVVGATVFYLSAYARRVPPDAMSRLGGPMCFLVKVGASLTGVAAALRRQGSEFVRFFNYRPSAAIALLCVTIFPVAVLSVLSWAMFLLRFSVLVVMLVYMLPAVEEDDEPAVTYAGILLSYILCWAPGWFIAYREWDWEIWAASAFGLVGTVAGTAAFYISVHARGVRADDMGVLGHPLRSLASSVPNALIHQKDILLLSTTPTIYPPASSS
ncbi:hypothetical protein MSAN_02251200 [Mycena sanguinolenta]|uniref:Uncharacterized protein n=1 Tax=Mycena sanguinolenta TaxID=230812 RepID=A0A8H6XC54_9AGAR|nr:hypothetical protein MSAN_02251200 [Mycena sanguinolenta]